MKGLRSVALGLLALAALAHGLPPGRAEAADAVPPLFTSAPDSGRQALGPAQAERLAAYRADREAAEVTVVRLPTDLLKGAAAVSLNLPAAAEIPLSVVSVDQRSAQDYSWRATGAGGRSEATLVVRDGNVVGTIRSGGLLYRLRPLGDGAAALVRVDQRRIPPEHPPGFGTPERQRFGQPRRSGAGTPARSADAADSGAEYTAIVAYTTAAAASAGDIDALIQLAADETNQGYASSGVNTRIRIVHKYRTGYAESGDMFTDLTRFETSGDGYADEVHGLRDEHAADVALIITDAGDYCGVASDIYVGPEEAFAVVAATCATGYYSFAHEIGHLQGARHDPDTDPSTFPFPYGHGYRYPAGGWRTIMAYACPSTFCERINRWANPNLTYGGVPTGTAAVSHDARVLNETAERVANFRTGGGSGGGPGWHPWASRGGSLASFPECERAGSRIDCWAQAAGGTLAWYRSADGDSWSGPTNLGGSVASAPECLVRGGRIDCFVTTPARRLAQVTYDGSGWGGWVDLGGAVTARPSCVAGAAGLALDCFAAGADRTLHRRSFDGSAWMPWERLGGSTANRPECMARSGGIDCLVVDAGGNLHTRRLSGGRWGAWQRLAGGFGLAPHCLVSANKLDCFAQGSGLGLLKGYFDGSRWARWTSVAGSNGVNVQPYCNRVGPSGFDCYWTNRTGDLIRRVRSASAWLAEENLDGSVQQRPVCLAGSGGRIDCLARGLDNTLQERSYH